MGGTRQWICVRHSAYEGAGMFETVAEQHGVTMRTVATDLGDDVPDAAHAAGVVVLGGPFAVADAAARRHLDDERRLLADAVSRGLPVMGVCLGAQLLASALGADVRTAPEEERGMRDVTITAEGADDPLLGPEAPTLRAFQYHGDTYTLPDGAVRLATSPACHEQAFRWGPRAYALQFHMELSAPFADYVPAPIRPTPGERTVLSDLARRIIRRFFALSATVSAVGGRL
jgi:GMP synthase (glutamine-hydrolysing)